jgi:hypothetical protein
MGIDIPNIVAGIITLLPWVGAATLAAWITLCRGSANFRAQIGLLTFFLWIGFSGGYATLWSRTARWQLNNLQEVHWGPGLMRVYCSTLLAAIISEFCWDKLEFGWAHLFAYGASYLLLLFGMVTSGTMGYIFWAVGLVLALMTLASFAVGSQDVTKRGRQFRVYGALLGMAMGTLGTFFFILIDRPFADVFEGNRGFIWFVLAALDIGQYFVLPVWALVLTMPVPGQIARQSEYLAAK